MQQRRDEILAKKAKLAELKRQRELRKAETASRQSLTGSPLGEVGNTVLHYPPRSADKHAIRSSHQHQGEAKTLTGEPTSTPSLIVFWGRAGRGRRALGRPPAQDEQRGRRQWSAQAS